MNIMFELMESCRQAGFQLADSVEAVLLLLLFFPKCSRVSVIPSMATNNSLGVFVSPVPKVGVLAFSDIGFDNN